MFISVFDGITKEKGKEMRSVSEDNYIDIETAANYLGIKTVTLRGWIKTKDIPAYRIGKMWKFKRSELDFWVSSGKSAIREK